MACYGMSFEVYNGRLGWPACFRAVLDGEKGARCRPSLAMDDRHTDNVEHRSYRFSNQLPVVVEPLRAGCKVLGAFCVRDANIV